MTVVNPVETSLPLLQKPHFAYPKQKAPPVLEELAVLISEADAYVMVTPEYNHAVLRAQAREATFASCWAPSLTGSLHPHRSRPQLY